MDFCCYQNETQKLTAYVKHNIVSMYSSVIVIKLLRKDLFFILLMVSTLSVYKIVK